ncbi:hypothetical protein G9C98_003660 [Cotesia typhae]|uniref:C2H2-type domain-containing protein n=2 Tax=Cotesia typhae TaxID=2053667 RepID=A0A8J5QXM9_9HYME|nr:hypothetical protein G9C98_003660 [Cotesia typhae]
MNFVTIFINCSKMKAKTRTKKSDRKFTRHKLTPKDSPQIETPICDFSNLCKPIDTSLSNLVQVTKLLETANDEIKYILTYECEVIYECKICRSLFRSLLNFISHKRIYCPEQFNISNNKDVINPQVMVVEKSIDSECEENYEDQKSSKNEALNRKFSKKDLTSVITMLQKKQADPNYNDVEERNRRTRIVADTEQVLLEVLDSNRAAFQTVLEPKLSNIASNDLMKAQTIELQSILSRDTAVLGPDGSILAFSNDGKVDNKDIDKVSNHNLVCSTCNVKFATKKTLTFHIKSLHTPNRLVYPCPCCPSLFPSTWGVYRHLVKVHRKSNAQVRKLRSEIQTKAYLKETTRAQDIDKDCANNKLNNSKESRLMNETEEWMTHLESDTELQRCGGCNKRFDRKAALLAHSQICQRRQAACSDVAIRSKRNKIASEANTEKISPLTEISKPTKENLQIPIKKISMESESRAISSSVNFTSLLNFSNISPAVSITRLPQQQQANEIRVEGIASLSKDAWEKIGDETSKLRVDTSVDVLTIPSEAAPTKISPNDNVSDDPEIIFTNIEKPSILKNKGSKKRKMGKRNTSIDSNKRINLLVQENNEKMNSAKIISKSDTNLDEKINFISPQKFECIPCKLTFSNLTHLRRHMTEHMDWYRFRCKLCEFKCFNKIDCVAHCNKIHNAKNSRMNIENMVIESTFNEKPTNSSRSLLKKCHVTIPVIQNGNNSTDDNNSCSVKSCEELPDENSEMVKKAKLGEDSELRRMVMEVIFGSSETVNEEEPGSSTEIEEIRDYKKNSKMPSKTYSDPEENSLNHIATMKLSSNHNRLSRNSRNRTKLENKNFIYDLDAVLVKDTATDGTGVIVEDNKTSTNIMNNESDSESDLSVVLYRDRTIVKTKLEKVA